MNTSNNVPKLDIQIIKEAIIKLTNRCTLHCRYCYMEHKKSDLSIDLLKKFLKESIPLGLKNIYLHGGEPLLRPLSYFSELINFLEKENLRKKVMIYIQTNGMLLTPEIINGFKKMDIRIGVSLDGPEKIHNLNRGGWKKTMEAIANLQKERVNFGVISVITKNTLKYTTPKNLLNFYLEHNLRSVGLAPCQEAGFIIDKSVIASPEQYSNFMNKFFDEWCKLKRNDFIVREFEDIVAQLVLVKDGGCCVTQSGKACAYTFELTSDGYVYPCDWYQDKKYCGGNIKDTDTRTVILRSRSKFFKTIGKKYSAHKKKDCVNCQWFLLCRGGCPLSIVNKTNFWCQSRKLMYQHIASRLKTMGFKLKYLDALKKQPNI